MITALNAHGIVLGWSHKGATQKYKKTLRLAMSMDYRIIVKYKLDYLKLALKITELRFRGDEPPVELLQQAHEIGRLAGISEQELKNL